jgi:hypothetical protein
MTQLSSRLEDVIATTERDFAGISEADAAVPAIADGWSRKQILGHLIDSASNNHQRFVRAMLQDELRWPSYDQSGNVRVQRYQDARWHDLIGFWAAYNRFLAHVIAGIPDAKRSTPCWIGEYPMMTLEELAADYLTHLEHHLDQIRVKTRFPEPAATRSTS